MNDYFICPYQFYVRYVLKLLPTQQVERDAPNAAQYGSIIHDILEALLQPYLGTSVELDALLAAIPTVVADYLDMAPEQHNFRPPAWWRQTCIEIEKTIRETLIALHKKNNGFVPIRLEQTLNANAPIICEGESFYLRGRIDRIDQDTAGNIRIIDYKTNTQYTGVDKKIQQGTLLQLPLYALAAQEGLALGKVVDGFYWHVKAEKLSSQFTKI